MSQHGPHREGSGRIENACGGITGRSPSLGDHLSGRQTRKHVRRSRSRVPAALLLGVLASTWGLLGSFLVSWGSLQGLFGHFWSWGLLGALGTLLGRSCGDIKATVGAVKFLIVFWIDF